MWLQGVPSPWPPRLSLAGPTVPGYTEVSRVGLADSMEPVRPHSPPWRSPHLHIPTHVLLNFRGSCFWVFSSYRFAKRLRNSVLKTDSSKLSYSCSWRMKMSSCMVLKRGWTQHEPRFCSPTCSVNSHLEAGRRACMLNTHHCAAVHCTHGTCSEHHWAIYEALQ